MSTSLAVLLTLHYPTALVAMVTFIIVVLITKYVSLSSILAAVSAIIASFIFFRLDIFSVFCTMIGVLCIVRHHSNIKRLLEGTENKLGQRRKEQ